MTPTCHELRSNAAGLMSLPNDDAERAAAETHAKACSGCAAALREGRAVMRLLEVVPAPPDPSAESLARARAAVLAEIAAEGGARIPTWPTILAVLAAFGGVLALAKEAQPFGRGYYEAFSLLAATLAIAALSRNARTLWMTSLGALLASAGFSLIAGAGSELFGVYGLRCLAVELFASALPLGLATIAAFRGTVPATPLHFATVAALGALAGQAALHVTCRAGAQLPHLLVTHTLGVAAAALLGAAISRMRGLRAPAQRANARK
jgi:hypothetical protein